MTIKSVFAWALPTAALAASLSPSTAARANPRPLPFTYPYETLGQDEAEIEQYIDATPERVADPDRPDGKRWNLGYHLQTEVEYGITDRLELGLYVVGGQDAGGPFVLDGTKQRLRLRLAEAGEWPVDVAIYGEVSELHDELELEEKLILAKRLGRARILANLWFEQSFYDYSGKLHPSFDPAGGVAFRVAPKVEIGAEYWARIPLASDDAELPSGGRHFVGPTISLQMGKLWWSNGVYKRLDHMSDAVEVGDTYGQVWWRSVFGINL